MPDFQYHDILFTLLDKVNIYKKDGKYLRILKDNYKKYESLLYLYLNYKHFKTNELTEQKIIDSIFPE